MSTRLTEGKRKEVNEHKEKSFILLDVAFGGLWRCKWQEWSSFFKQFISPSEEAMENEVEQQCWCFYYARRCRHWNVSKAYNVMACLMFCASVLQFVLATVQVSSNTDWLDLISRSALCMLSSLLRIFLAGFITSLSFIHPHRPRRFLAVNKFTRPAWQKRRKKSRRKV